MKVTDKQRRKQRKMSKQMRNICPPLAVLVLTLLLGACVPLQSAHSNRQAEVAERGAEVMPFDLEQTMHIFTPQDNGGLQKVVVKESADSRQIELIRSHLQEEAERFRNGDFADPGQIHGHEMPGLTELRQHQGRINIRYSELPNGAQIEYITDDPQLIEAIHHWFQAQLMDHGRHATQ